MLRDRYESRAPANDTPVPAMAASLSHLHEILPLENPIDLPCGEDAHP